MKKFILTILSCSLLNNCFSQIRFEEPTPRKTMISENKPVGFLQSELFYEIYKIDTLYTITYRNAKYKSIDFKSVSFYNKNNTF